MSDAHDLGHHRVGPAASDWLDDVLAWLREPLTAMRLDRVMARLGLAFDVTGVRWNDQHGSLMTRMRAEPERGQHVNSAQHGESQRSRRAVGVGDRRERNRRPRRDDDGDQRRTR